jgi:hypothetical protein
VRVQAPEDAYRLGVRDVNRDVRAIVQEFRSSVTALTDLLIEQRNKGVEIPRILIALDSAGNLATQKEIDDAKNGSDKADMTRAKLLKSTFRILMTKLGICKIPFLFTNHTYMTQDLFAKQVGGGGTGPEYAASIILFLAKAKLSEGAEQTGIIVTAKPNKNRFAKTLRAVGPKQRKSYKEFARPPILK